MPPAHPARRRLRARLSRGHLLMLLAGLTGTALTLVALRSADDTVAVVVATRDLAPGTVLDASALGTTRVRAERPVLSALVVADDLDDAIGRVVTRRLAAGWLLERSVLVDASAGRVPRALSFPVPRARAVGGAIVAGDRIDAVAVDRGSARARFVLVGAEILAVDHDAGGPLAATDDVVVTVAVDAPSALRLAGALESGTLTLVRATGAVALDDAGPSERTQ